MSGGHLLAAGVGVSEHLILISVCEIRRFDTGDLLGNLSSARGLMRGSTVERRIGSGHGTVKIVTKECPGKCLALRGTLSGTELRFVLVRCDLAPELLPLPLVSGHLGRSLCRLDARGLGIFD